MTKSNFIQALFCLIIIIIASSLANLFDFFMPMGFQYILIALATVLFSLVAKKLLAKTNLDEREQQLELINYKYAYIISNTILLATIFYQSLIHNCSPVLVFVLGVSLFSKIIISFIRK